MQTSDMQKALLIGMADYTTVSITRAMAEAWMLAFGKLEKEIFLNAFFAAKKTSGGFPPTIGQVEEILRHLATPPADQLTEGEAWQLLNSAVQRFGHVNPDAAKAWLALRSERIARTVEQLGWGEICQWRTDSTPANRAHFWRVYSALVQRDLTAERLGIPKPEPLKKIERNLQEKSPQISHIKTITESLLKNLQK